MKAYWRLIVSNAAVNQLDADERDFYVSPKGDDANPGTMDAPLKTIGRAVELSEPGKTIHPMGGRYEEEVFIDRPVHIRPLRLNVAVMAGLITIRSSNVDINGLVFDGVERPIIIEGEVNELLIRQNRFIDCAGPVMTFATPAGGDSFIIGNAVSGNGIGPGIRYECVGLQETVIASNRFHYCETGIAGSRDTELLSTWATAPTQSPCRSIRFLRSIHSPTTHVTASTSRPATT
jgi:hypothetical protein